MSADEDDIDLGKLSDREILVLVASNQKKNHGRLNRHGERIQRIERIMLIGSGVVLAVKIGVEWFRVQLGGK